MVMIFIIHTKQDRNMRQVSYKLNDINGSDSDFVLQQNGLKLGIIGKTKEDLQNIGG